MTDAISAAIQDGGIQDREGAILTGYALVAQWMDPDGDSWLSRSDGGNLPPWQIRGMWHEALYGDWAEE